MPRRRARSAPAASLITPAQQRRSRDTHDAIVDAFRELLAAKGFAEISVAQIAKRAGSSVGGVYARFASKDALLIPVLDDILGEGAAALDEALDATAAPGHTLADVVDAYVGTMVTMFRRHRVGMLHVVRAAKGETARALQERIHAFNVHAHGRFRTLAWNHRAEIRHASPKLAIELALFFGSAAGREGILSENWRSYDMRPNDETLAREIGTAMLAFLRGAKAARASR
jgi:AcrR family transcriptional regulator